MQWCVNLIIGPLLLQQGINIHTGVAAPYCFEFNIHSLEPEAEVEVQAEHEAKYDY